MFSPSNVGQVVLAVHAQLLPVVGVQLQKVRLLLLIFGCS